MANEAAKSDLADLIDTVQAHVRSLASAHEQRAQLTASATACDKRIRVTVNADGVLIDTTFADDIADLTYDEIAAAMTEAAQSAAAKVKAEAEQLFQPLQKQRSRLPSLSEMVPGLPDLRDSSLQPRTAPTTPPGHPDRQRDNVTQFDDVVPQPVHRSVVADADW
ncbi:YbaB/EbfC family nucleoid-associated protein [Nocardia sp. NPDC052566]|uniref:YbaB/EbfC family nucleoid-associated protein n=1 Tax=Nocardia sp. NPDC052566 TaxID=3364330 RepID=UPI0037C8395D